MHKHTKECQEELDITFAQTDEWKEEWPDHCKKCMGGGYFVGWQSVPYGSTSASFEVFEPCECTEGGRCPRCGEPVIPNELDEKSDEYWALLDDWLYESNPCPHCGWKWDGEAWVDFVPDDPNICPCVYMTQEMIEKTWEEND